MTHRARDRVQDVGAATIGADPDQPVAGLKQRHDSRGADATRVVWENGDGRQLARCSQLEQSIGKGPDPQVTATVPQQGHYTVITHHVRPAQQGVDGGSSSRAGIELGQAAAERANPDLIASSAGERGHRLTAQPLRPMVAKLPTPRVPAADTRGAGAYPDQTRLVL